MRGEGKKTRTSPCSRILERGVKKRYFDRVPPERKTEITHKEKEIPIFQLVFPQIIPHKRMRNLSWIVLV